MLLFTNLLWLLLCGIWKSKQEKRQKSKWNEMKQWCSSSWTIEHIRKNNDFWYALDRSIQVKGKWNIVNLYHYHSERAWIGNRNLKRVEKTDTQFFLISTNNNGQRSAYEKWTQGLPTKVRNCSLLPSAELFPSMCFVLWINYFA